MDIRQNLPFKTIFNLLGPLLNPAKLKYQLLGVGEKKNLETENLLTVAWLMVKSAKMRKESRGSHCRLDYQDIDNKYWNKSIFWRLENEYPKYKLGKYRQDPNNIQQIA